MTRSAETRISSSTFFSPSRASMTSTDAVHGVSTSRETRAWTWPVNATGSSGVMLVFAVPTNSSAAESGDRHKVPKSKPIVHSKKQRRIIHPSSEALTKAGQAPSRDANIPAKRENNGSQSRFC